MTPARARAVLKAPPGADRPALVRAYRAALKSTHPDLGGSDSGLREVVEAYRLLQGLAVAVEGRTGAARVQPGVHRLEITVAEALFGGEREVSIAGREFTVALPPGLRAGELLRFDGAVTVRIAVASDGGMALRGDDLWLEVASPLPAGRVEIDTPKGKRWIWVKPKAGSRTLVRLPGEGLPARAGRKAGDLFVRLKAPERPPERPARALLRRFSETWAAG